MINSIFPQRDYNIRVIGIFKKYVNTFYLNIKIVQENIE